MEGFGGAPCGGEREVEEASENDGELECETGRVEGNPGVKVGGIGG